MYGPHPSRWISLLIIGALSAFGCVSSDTSQGGESGSLSLDLMLDSGVEINEVDWELSGNGMAPMAGTIDTSDPNSTPSVEVFGLPPGEDYTVALEATSADEEVTCRGSATFDISVGELTDVMVMMNCKLPEVLGGVRVNGKFNHCAQLAKVVVSPLQTSVGSTIDLASLGEDAEGDDIAYVWSATGGSIADSGAASTTYTCGMAGEQTITITISDDDFEYCMDDWTVPVTCVAVDGDLCEDVTCDDTGNECTEAACDPADGQCKASNVDDGTICDGGDGICSNGECVNVDLCLDVTCDDDGNECTETTCDPADGVCKTSNVNDGTDCMGGEGMCVNGDCVATNLCEDVTCDDTGNECTVEMCNLQSGECEVMNVPDGTSCNDGAGACSAGECVDGSLCDDVDCTSSNDCVQDGTCDPADGSCIAGANEPADTACTSNGGSFCDGAGNCVDCNNDGQCPSDGNECTAAVCDASDGCIQNNVMDGQSCDFGGADGVCENGTCVEAPGCTMDSQCDDGNPCTAGTCPDGACVFTPVDGGTCEVSAGVPGTCSGGDCVGLCQGVDCTSTNDCVQDGTCDDQTGQCSTGANEAADTVCNQDGGSVCDGQGNCVECNSDGQCDVELNETCVNNVCVAQATACGTQSQTVQIGCSNGVTDAQSPFPNQMTITVNEAVLAGQNFTVEASGVGAFPKFFLDAAQSTVPGGVRSAIVEGFNATVQASGGTGTVLLQADPDQVSPGLLRFCAAALPGNSRAVCTSDADCVSPSFPPCLPDEVLVIDVPISEDCAPGGFCAGLGQGTGDGASAQCNITNPPSFCVASDLSVPMYAPGGPEVFTAGAGPGNVTFNWAVDPATVTCPNADSRCASSGGALPDNALVLPPSIYGNPVGNPGSVGLNGIRLNVAGALFVALQCSAGSDGGVCVGGSNADLGCGSDSDCPGSTCDGIGVDDDIIVATDPATLPACPIN